MRKIVTLIVTIICLGIIHAIITYSFHASFIDISIPFGVGAILISYIFTNKSGMLTRQMDMQVQGQTGIRMGINSRVNSLSFIFLGSIVYFLFTLVATFYTYKEYFVN